MVGKHNFYHFITLSKPMQKNIIRKIQKIKIKKIKSSYIIKIYAESFLHHQIRYLIGALIDCFFNRISKSELIKLLNEPLIESFSKKQKKFFLVPGRGLTLTKIFY